MHNQIIDKYYPEDNDLRNILITHSTLVMQRAVRICDAHPELHIDRQFVIEAAMLRRYTAWATSPTSVMDG